MYRVARRLVATREEAEDLVQDTYGRAFRSWQSYTPGTNLRAWLLRILTNLNLDRGRKMQRTPDMQPIEEGDYYLANKMAEAQGEQIARPGPRRRAALAGLDRERPVLASPRLPRHRRARRHRRVQLRRRGADPRRPDRHRDVAAAPWPAAAEAEACRGGDLDEPYGPCDACEELLQGYLDRELTDAEVAQAESHLDGCDYCRRRYRFEVSLRQYVQTTAVERMPAGPDGEADAAPLGRRVAGLPNRRQGERPTGSAQPFGQVGRGVDVAG